MRIKQLLTKTLLAAAGLCVGASAWADITYNTTLVDQDFSDVSSESTNWATGSGMALAQTLRSGSDYYYTMSFGNSGNAASTADYNLPSLSGYDAYQFSFLWGLYSCSASNRNSLFKIVGSSGDFATTGYIAGGSSSLTLTCGETATSLDIDKYATGTRGNANRTTTLYKITVEGVSTGDDAGIYLTITNEDESVTKLAKTKISSTYQTITSLHFESGQYYGQQAIDDVLLKAYSASDIVSLPSIAITGVSGESRTVTITNGTSSMGNVVTTYYTTDGTEPTDASTAYTAPLTITSSCTVKAISYTSVGNSEVASLAVATGAVALASPSVTYKSAVFVDNEYIMTPTFTINAPNNSDVLLTPETETLEYTFTPDGGSESARTAISSGEEFTPMANGTLKVYANTTGYSESSYSIPVSNYYSVATTLDYAGLYNEAQGEWSASTNDWGYDAYTVKAETWPSSGLTYNRLNIRNNNTVDYVVGFGFGRFGNAYNAFRIRNQVKGNFFNVIISTVAAEPATSNQIIFCTQGNGADGDVASISSVAGNNVIKTIFEYEPCDVPTISPSVTDYATFASTYALDFTSATGVKAYYASASDGSAVTMTKVTGAVAAGTGLLLQKVDGEISIPVAASGTDLSAANLLKAGTGADVVSDAEYSRYVLAGEGDATSFYNLATAYAVPVGKAYLEVAKSPGARLAIVFSDGETTGIANVEKTNAVAEGIYNLNGQRVAAPQKGLYIVNGKKVIKK